jgi:hypothetical protein
VSVSFAILRTINLRVGIQLGDTGLRLKISTLSQAKMLLPSAPQRRAARGQTPRRGIDAEWRKPVSGVHSAEVLLVHKQHWQ